MNPRARITRIHTSWRVRVPGHPPTFFADGSYSGGERASLAAAIAWRDANWDGTYRLPSQKLSPAQRAEIAASDEPAAVLAARYGISRQYAWNLRSKKRRG